MRIKTIALSALMLTAFQCDRPTEPPVIEFMEVSSSRRRIVEQRCKWEQGAQQYPPCVWVEETIHDGVNQVQVAFPKYMVPDGTVDEAGTVHGGKPLVLKYENVCCLYAELVMPFWYRTFRVPDTSGQLESITVAGEVVWTSQR